MMTTCHMIVEEDFFQTLSKGIRLHTFPRTEGITRTISDPRVHNKYNVTTQVRNLEMTAMVWISSAEHVLQERRT